MQSILGIDEDTSQRYAEFWVMVEELYIVPTWCRKGKWDIFEWLFETF